MPLDVKHGWFIKQTATGNQVVAGVGFSGKAFVFYSADQTTNDGTKTDTYVFNFGLSDGTANNLAIAANSLDANTTSNAYRRTSNSGSLFSINHSGIINYRGAVSAVDGDSFTINWIDQTVAISGYIHYDAYGGDDVVNAKVMSVPSQSGHGVMTSSGMGFSGNIIMGFNGNLGSNTLGAVTVVCIGMASDVGSEFALALNSEDAQGTSDTWRNLRTDAFYTTLTNAGAMNVQGKFDGFVADGFKINWISGATSNNRPMGVLCMKISGNTKVGTFNFLSGTGNMSTSGVGFSGKHVILTTHGTSSSTVMSGFNRVSLGGAVSATQRGVVWAGDEDNAANMVNARATNSGMCILMADEAATGSSSTDLETADFVAFHSDGITINRITNAFTGNTSGMTVGYFTVGEIPPPAAPSEGEIIQPKAFVMGPSTMDNVHQGFGEGGFQPGNLPPLFGQLKSKSDSIPLCFPE